jgi:hypothetical protein
MCQCDEVDAAGRPARCSVSVALAEIRRLLIAAFTWRDSTGTGPQTPIIKGSRSTQVSNARGTTSAMASQASYYGGNYRAVVGTSMNLTSAEYQGQMQLSIFHICNSIATVEHGLCKADNARTALR